MARGRLLVALLAMVWLASTPIPSLSDLGPEFQLGFKTLADLIPETAGDPLENEHHNAVNGDGLQMTTTGLMVWRKADNWTAFTDGWRTWVNGPFGLQERYNDERFDWETDASSTDEDASPPDQPADPASASPDPLAVEPESTPTSAFDSATPWATAASAAPTATALEAASPEATLPASPFPIIDPTAEPTEVSTAAPSVTSIAEPSTTPTATEIASDLPTATPTRPPEPSSTPTPIPGGVLSETPAGDWVTSTSASAKYYTTKEDPYWQSWAAGNRIWFASESALRAVYPTRDRRDWAPTATTGPTATPTRSAQPTATSGATATHTPIPGGTISPNPGGNWVTSTSASAKYYCAKESSYWQGWVPENRIWFATETALLAAFPERTRWEEAATSTAAPTATPTRPTPPTATSVPPTATTVAPTATRTPIPGGIVSSTPAGDWVTSTASNTKYYTTKEDSYWQTWAAGNRIWFSTEAALLAAYPGRTKR